MYEVISETVAVEVAGEVIEVVAVGEGKVTAYSELDAAATAVIAPSQSLLLPCDEFDAMIGDGA